jgi:hypothetical protein
LAAEEKEAVPVLPVVRRRVIALGLPLSLGAFWLVVQIEQVRRAGMPTSLALYYPVIVALLALVAVNALLRRLAPRAAATQGELLCLYSMMAVGSAFACWEMLGTLIPAIGFPSQWQAVSPDRHPVGGLVLRLLPGPVLLRDAGAADQLFNGSRPWESLRLAPWTVPLLLWGALLALTQAMAAAAGRLLYPRWAHGEKLSFPLVAVPLAVTDPDGRLWRSRVFWLAFVGVVLLDLSNGAHLLYPAWPEIVVKMPFWLNTDARTPAAQGMGSFPLSTHPLMLGLAFLLPTDLLFSGWFFFLMGKLQVYLAGTQNLVEGEGMRWQFGGNFPGLIEQNTGAFLVLGMAALRSAWPEAQALWERARGGDADSRRSVFLLIGGAIVWAAALLALGVPPLLVPPFLLLAALLAVVVARMRAEMGLPVHNLHQQGPDVLLPTLLGPRALGAEALTGLLAFNGILRSQQGAVMPHQMEGAYLAEQAGALTKRYWTAVTLAGVVAALVGPWILVSVVSRGDGMSMSTIFFTSEGWEKIARWTAASTGPDLRALGEVAFGAAVTAGLIALRVVWVQSPLHPLGYALSGSWGCGRSGRRCFWPGSPNRCCCASAVWARTAPPSRSRSV